MSEGEKRKIMNDNVIYIEGVFLKQELLRYKDTYSVQFKGFLDFYSRLSTHLVVLNNFKDFSDRINIQDSVELQSLRKELTCKLECIKYIRHRICGHVDWDFVEQAIKWDPMLLIDYRESNDKERSHAFIADMFAKSVIECAINSFQKDNPSNKVFHGELDMAYPPNYKEFESFIEYTNEKAIRFLELLIELRKSNIHFYDNLYDALPAIKEAGEIEFGTKKNKTI